VLILLESGGLTVVLLRCTVNTELMDQILELGSEL